MAHELYDTMMQDNFWYEYWKNTHPGLSAKSLEREFVQKNMALLVPQAREALAALLRGPEGNLDDKQRETIYEALVLDNTLIRGRA